MKNCVCSELQTQFQYRVDNIMVGRTLSAILRFSSYPSRPFVLSHTLHWNHLKVARVLV